MAMFQQESPDNPESHCLLAPEDSLARLELSFTFSTSLSSKQCNEMVLENRRPV
jgi:hypothetical protein